MAAIPNWNDLDMNQFEILNGVIQILDTDPTSPVEGQFYYNTTDKKIHWFDGTQWRVASTMAELSTQLAAKVDKVSGKQLSTEDYTTAEKQKLEGIQEGAEANVQPDWNASSGAAQILNKPTLGTAASHDVGTAAGQIPVLNGSGKLPDSTIPPLAIGEMAGNVDNKTDLTTLSSAQQGDIAIVTADTDVNNCGVYWLNGVYSTLENWIQIVGPGSVISVNGQSGVVTLAAADVGAVPVTRTVNGKPLNADVSLAADDVNAVPNTRKVNNKALNTDITLTPSDVGAVPTERKVNGHALSTDIQLSSADVGAVAANEAVTGATHPVITYDSKGLVTGGRALQANDIPSLDAAKIATGTLAVARIPTGNASGAVPLLGAAAQDGQALVWDQESQRYVPQTLTTGNTNTFTGEIVGDGTTTTFTLAHGLGKRGNAQIRDASGKSINVVNTVDATNVVVTFGRAPSADMTFNVTVVG